MAFFLWNVFICDSFSINTKYFRKKSLFTLNCTQFKNTGNVCCSLNSVFTNSEAVSFPCCQALRWSYTVHLLRKLTIICCCCCIALLLLLLLLLLLINSLLYFNVCFFIQYHSGLYCCVVCSICFRAFF